MQYSSIYPFQLIEKKWKALWKTNKTFVANLDLDNKFYNVTMFPYPSGNIHIGHVRVFTLADTQANYKRLKNFNVIYPLGYDSFGLPAENASREYNTHPAHWTLKNIDHMESQIDNLCLTFSPNLNVSTCEESYYKHQMELVSKMFEKKLFVKKKGLLNWDPVDKTVLANEQVINGKGWRSGAKIEKKPMEQWFFKITDYAKELFESIDTLTNWPEDIKEMQKNWIGQTQGYSIPMELHSQEKKPIKVFTMYPDLVFGATHVIVSPQHEFTMELIESNQNIKNFVDNYKDEQPLDSVFSGIYVENPFNKDHLPLYITPSAPLSFGFVLGIGTIDTDFIKMNNIKRKLVIEEGSCIENCVCNTETCNCVCCVDNTIIKNSDWLNGLRRKEARNELVKRTGKVFIDTVYRLQDWCVSRKRAWGCPTPVASCNNCKEFSYGSCETGNESGSEVSRKSDQKLTKLTKLTWLNAVRERLTYKPGETGNDFNESAKKIHEFSCPHCETGIATIENDTLDTFVDSSWYFLRYVSQGNNPIDKDTVNKIMPIDLYSGGREHAILHLLYTRFFTKVLSDLELINFREPVKKLFTQGMVCMNVFRRTDNNNYIEPSKLYKENNKYYTEDRVEVRVEPAEKMSKSKKNVIDPDYIVSTYGAFACKLFIISDTPMNKDFFWDDNALKGCWTFVNSLWRLAEKILTMENTGFVLDSVKKNHFVKLILDAQKYVENINLNLYVATIRVFTRDFVELLNSGINDEMRDIWFEFVKLLSICGPEFAEECFSKIKNSEKFSFLGEDLNKTSIFDCRLKTNYLIDKSVYEFKIFINNKVQATITVADHETEEDIKNRVFTELKIEKANVKNVFFKKNLLINIIV